MAASVQPGTDLFKAFQQSAVGHRLHQVVGHAVLQRRAEILVVAVAAEKDLLDLRAVHQAAAQLKTVHVGHFNIGQHNIDRVMRDVFQRLTRAGKDCRHLKADVLPREQLRHAPRNLLLIIHDDQFVHAFDPHYTVCCAALPYIPVYRLLAHSARHNLP